MQTIPAREIKRCGISAVDDALREGPVHVIKNDRLSYVILTEEQYAEFLEANAEAYRYRLMESMEDVRAGRVRRSTAQEIIDEFGLED